MFQSKLLQVSEFVSSCFGIDFFILLKGIKNPLRKTRRGVFFHSENKYYSITGRSSSPEPPPVFVLPSISLSIHIKSTFCIAAFNSSPGWKLIFTQLISVAFRSSFLSLPLLLRDGENVPQSPSFTLCPSAIKRWITFRSWRIDINASDGFRVVSSEMSSATFVSGTNPVEF